MARTKRIYILMIRVNKLMFFFASRYFLKGIENMFSLFLSSYRNTRESLGELEKHSSWNHSSAAVFLVLPNFHLCLYFLNCILIFDRSSVQHSIPLSIKLVSNDIDEHFRVRAKFDLVVPVLTSWVKFYTTCDIANLVQVCASNSYSVNICNFASGVACAPGSSVSAAVFTVRFLILQVNYFCAEWRGEGLVPAAHQVALVLLIRQEGRCFLRFFLFVSCYYLLHSHL